MRVSLLLHQIHCSEYKICCAETKSPRCDGCTSVLLCRRTHTYTTEHSNSAYAQQPSQPASRPCCECVYLNMPLSLSPLDMGQAGQYHTIHTELNWLSARTVFYTNTIRARFTIYWSARRPFCILLRYYIIRTARVCGIKWKKKAVRFSNELLSHCKIPRAPALHSV